MRAARAVTGLVLCAVLASCGGNPPTASPTASPTSIPTPSTSFPVSSTPSTPTDAPLTSAPLAATSAPASPAESPSPDGEQSPQDEFADALDQRLGPNGEIDKQLAIDMFATVYGGVAELRATVLPGAVEPSTALRVIYQTWDQLTPEERQIVQQKVDLPVESSETIPASGAAGQRLALRAVLGPGDRALVRAQLDAVASLWGSPLGRDLQIDLMTADLAPIDDAHGPPLADTLQMQSDTTRVALSLPEYAVCRIRLFPIFATLSATDKKATAAHEIFHCFQGTVISLTDSVLLRSGQLWVVEGQAEWAGAQIAGGGGTAEDWWETWLTKHFPLWKRGYDAIGFYASLARHSVDPWTIFRPMLSLGAAPFSSMYAAATPGLPISFLAQVAVDHSSLDTIGDPWLPVGPGAITIETDPVEIAPGAGGFQRTLHLQAYDFEKIAVNVPEDVVTVISNSGPWALGGSGNAFIIGEQGSQSGCVSGPCMCPDGQALAIPHLATDGNVGIGMPNATTGLKNVVVKVISVTLATACATMPHETALTCLVGQWTLSGQQFDDPFVPGLQGIHYSGGIRGRHLDIAPNGAYVMTDDGSDPVTGHGETGGAPVDVTVTLTGRVDGTVERTSPTTARFASDTASIDLHVHEVVAGVPININHHYDDAAWFGNGDAVVTCAGNSLTTKFPNASFTYTKE